jgi:hypothetical protein
MLGHAVLDFGMVMVVLALAICLGIPAWALVNAARHSDLAFQRVGSHKARWIVAISVLTVFLNFIGVVTSIVYLATVRPRLKLAEVASFESWRQLDDVQRGAGADVLASDSDRDRVVHELRQHYATGCLTHEELDQRLDATLHARSVGQLLVLTRDLPRL